MKQTVFFSVTILILVATAMGYYFKKKNMPADVIYESRITVTGNARNISGHAAVVAPSAAVYYVEGLEEWEKDWLNQEVKITGDLVNKGERLVQHDERNIRRDSGTQVIKAAVVLLLQDEETGEY